MFDHIYFFCFELLFTSINKLNNVPNRHSNCFLFVYVFILIEYTIIYRNTTSLENLILLKKKLTVAELMVENTLEVVDAAAVAV